MSTTTSSSSASHESFRYISQLYVIPAVDAVEAGKGQLEISVNQGRVPNNVQMKGAGRCLVTFIPQHAGVYVIDVTFNGHQIYGCPIRVEVNAKQVGKPVSTAATSAITAGAGGITTKRTGEIRSTSLTQHGIAGTSPPPPPLPPANLSSPPPERTTFSPQPPSHHHHRISSPTYIDTSYSASRSPIQTTTTTTTSRHFESPRSPPLIHQQSPSSVSPKPRLSDAEGLKSPRLLRQTSPQSQTSPRLGYTIAHYGETRPDSRESEERSNTPRKYFGESGGGIQDVVLFKTTYEQRSPVTIRSDKNDSSVDSFSPKSYSTPKHKYFERDVRPDSVTTRQTESRYHQTPEGRNIHQHEELITSRGSSGVTSPVTSVDYRHDSRSDNKPRFEPINTRYSTDFSERYGSPEVRSPQPPPIRSPSPPAHRQEYSHRSPSPPNRNFGTMSSNIYDEIPAHPSSPPPSQRAAQTTATVSRVESLSKSREMERQPLEETERRTADFMRVKDEDDRILDQYGYNKSTYHSEPQQIQPTYQQQQRHYSGSEQEVKLTEPYPSDLDSLTPETRKKLESTGEKQLIKDYPQKNNKYEEEEAIVTRHEEIRVETPESKSSSKPTTPKLSLKFGKGDKNKGDQNGSQKGFDFGKSKFSSKHEVIRRGKDVEVKIESLKLGKEDQLKVFVTPPTKRRPPQEGGEYEKFQQPQQPPEIPHKLKKSGKTYEISFKPTDVGTHKIFAFVNDEAHPQSPFPIRVYDSSQIIIGEIVRESVINDTVEFVVDAGRAGFGNLEMAIKDSDGIIIPSHVSQLESGSAKFLVTFNPTSLGTFTVNVTFNKEVIKGSPFEVKIVENLSNVQGGGVPSDTSTLESTKKKNIKKEKKDAKKEKNGIKKGGSKAPSVEKIPSLSRVGKHAILLLSAPPGSQIEVFVFDASRNELPVQILNDEEGDEEIKQIRFIPEIVGDHEISIKVDDMEVTGSPFICRVHDPTKIKVGEIPNGIINKPVHFVVDAAEAGVGNLEVAVNEGTIASMARALGHHKYEISFVPLENIDHKISIRFNNEAVPGSPFNCRIGSDAQFNIFGTGLERIPVGKPAEFTIQTGDSKAQMPEIEVIDPRGDKVPVTVEKDAKGKGEFTVSYLPKTVGNHNIEVKYQGQTIGSPFTSKAFDAGQARLSLEEEAIVGRPCTFMIDAAKAGAGNMEIIVSVDGRNVPNFVQAESQAKFKVSFTPQEAKEHLISVKFNGFPIPGSPLRCHVSSPSSGRGGGERRELSPMTTAAVNERPKSNEEIRLVGDLAVAQIGKPKGFSIDSPKRNAECNVIVTGPNKKRLSVEIVKVDEGFDVEFLPQVLEPIGSFVNLPEIVNSGEKITFDVNVGKCNKKDDIRVEICGDDGTVIPATIKLDRNIGIAKVTCILPKTGSYFLDIYRNHLPLGERVHFNAAAGELHSSQPSSSEDNTSGVRILYFEKKAFADRQTTFELEIPQSLEKHINLEVLDPDGSTLPITLSQIEGHTFSAEWIPTTEGPHIVSVKINNKNIAGTPLTVSVLDLSAVRVIGLKNDAVGVQQRFNIDWSNSGGSNITVSIQHEDGEASKVSLKKIRQGLHVCTFNPKKPGLYLLNIYVDDVLLPECPYECVISNAGAVRARGDALSKAQRGKTARFEVSLGNATRGELDVLITDSLQGPLPVRCYKQQDDSYWVEFTPEQIGTHQIEVTFGEVPVAGSPFKCEVVDTKKVVIKNVDDPFIIRHVAKIAINRRAAGNGPLEIDITDPQGTPLKVEQIRNSVGDDQGFQVPGTPKQIIVEEQGMPTVYGAALDYAVEKDMQASMIFDPKKTNGGIKVDVRNPDGEKIRHSTNKRPDGTSEISFRGTQVGLYKVSIDFNNKPVGGSPFQVNVIDAKKVLINDEEIGKDGLLQLKVGQQNRIDVDTTAAGPGKLRAEVRDSEGELISDIATVDNLGYGKFQVVITPKHSGNLKIYLYWAEQVVPTAYPILAIAKGGESSRPIHGYQEAQTSREIREINTDTLNRIFVRGEGLKRATVKNPAEFIIDGSEVPDSKISSTLIGDKADIPVRLQHLGNNVYKATYIPLQGGDYELHIMVDGKHVRDSPYSVNVLSHSSPAELVVVDQKSLKLGIIGEDVKTIIDTRKAGSGFLSASCVGPSKLAYCELYDHRDGTYLLNLKPTELGKHTLTIKYSEEHVPGSPFAFNVSNPPDPSKVKVYGPGIEHGILHSFKSNFIVETKGAGAGQLTVRVRGPKGAFNVEMQRDKEQDRTIHCKYEPREPGDYQVEVKWHGNHVPGSPFFVMIVDTEEELKRFLAGEAPSQMPATPFIPPGGGPMPGWMGPPPPMGPPGAMMSPMGYPPPPNYPPGRRYGPPGPMGPMPMPIGPPPPQALQPRRRHH
uniref:Filamin n=1 Tax=Panagrolaimus sp. PS1159 TaxID=55785 RepID=A0AC35FWR0_9BILA